MDYRALILRPLRGHKVSDKQTVDKGQQDGDLMGPQAKHDYSAGVVVDVRQIFSCGSSYCCTDLQV